MTPKHKARDVAKSSYANFLQKAEECFHCAQDAFKRSDWNASAINAIHCCIAVSDAMCVYFLGKRHAGEDHNDAVKLFKSIKNTQENTTNAGRISNILKSKNMAEYEERLVRPKEAESILKDCERLLEYVKTQLPNL